MADNQDNQGNQETSQASSLDQLTQAARQLGQQHSNAVVPHKIANHDVLVQTSIWGGSDVGWINLNDTQDQLNTRMDLHKVEKTVQAQVTAIGDTVKRANDAVDQANKAIDSSNVNKAAIDAANSAIAEAKQSASDAVQKLQSVESSVNTTSDEVTKVKQSQADQIKQVTNQISDAVAQAKAATDSLDAKTTDLQTAVTNAQSDATVATQTASQASVTAIDAKGDAATALATAKQVTVDMKNAESDVMQAKATASEATITAGNAASDALVAKVTASSANLTATNASSDVAQVSAAADSLSTRVTAVESKATANSTAIDENAKAITLKADQTTVDALNKTVTDNSAAVSVLKDEIKLKVDSTTVNNILDSKGFATTNTVQSLVDQKASQISQTIADVKATVDGNGNAISATNDKVSNLTQAIDGIQTTVKNKADQSQITQLANALQVKLSGSIIAQAADVTLTYTGNENEYPPAAPLVGVNDVGKGSTLILSFDYVASADTKLTPQLDGDPWIPWGGIVNATPAAKGEKGSYSKTITVNDDSWQKGNAKNLCIRCDGFKGTIEITNLVLKYADTTLNDVQSSFDMLRDDINLRVTKRDLISQINLEAGGDGLISVQNGKGKLMLDADSVVFGNEAFIPSACITNINADKITTGTLNSIQIDNGNGKFTVNSNGDVTANSIKLRNGQFLQGTIAGSTIYALNNDGVQDPKLAPKSDWYKITPNMIRWFNHYDQSVGQIGVGQGVLTEGDSEFNGTPGLTISDSAKILLGTAQRTVVTGDEIGNLETTGLDWISNTNLEIKADGLQVNLDPDQGNEYDGKGARFSIQKNNKVGFYVGVGDNGNEVAIVGNGAIRLQGPHIDDGLSGTTHTLGNLQVDNLHVRKWLGVDSSKNAIVKTSQGTVAINAYETAEYYFGDIGEGQTDSNGVAYVGIEKLFNETVNTNIPYQVFLTAYGPGRLWVDQREHDRFVVKSDQPNIKFGWEIKAKRKGYEHTRLQNVDNKLNHMEATS